MTASKSRFVFTFSALILITLAVALLSFSAQAQASVQYAFAAEGRVYVGTVGGDIQDVVTLEDGFITALEWSDDGSLLAYSLRDNVGETHALYVTDLSGEAPRLVTENVAYMPFEFSDDGTKLYFAPEPPPGSLLQGANGAEYMLTVSEYDTATGETRERFVLPWGVGCGGGSPYLMDAAYSTDAGFMGNALVFEIVGENIIYSSNCSGLGVTVSGLDGQQIVNFDTLARARLSSDQSALVGVTMNPQEMRPQSIVIVDLATLEQRVLDSISAASVDQVAWGADINTIYYSTRVQSENGLELPEQAIPRIAMLFGDGFSVPRYDVTINRYNRATGESVTVYTGNDWAVGRMFDAGGVLYASLVPDGSAWLAAIASGEINDETTYLMERTYTLPQVVMLDVGGVPMPLVRGELFALRPVLPAQG